MRRPCVRARESGRERESCKVVITTCRYGRNEISCSNETRNVMSPSSQAEASRRIKEAPADFRVSQNRSIGCRAIERRRERERDENDIKGCFFLKRYGYIVIFRSNISFLND